MQFKENPYYSPELCGLEIFDQLDTGRSYEFDMIVIWKKVDDGTLWWDSDAGCSCPTPFEGGRHDLRPLTVDTFHDFDHELEDHYKIERSDYLSIINDVKEYLNI